jgi:hypothetical protein
MKLLTRHWTSLLGTTEHVNGWRFIPPCVFFQPSLATGFADPQQITAAREAAAAAIVERINASPTTPTVDEIAALIGPPAAQGVFAPTIGAVADEIARLWRDYDVLNAGDTRQSQMLEADPGTPRVRGIEQMKTPRTRTCGSWSGCSFSSGLETATRRCLSC